ncbi:hypothetical protein ACIAEU_23680, partial [Enterobacter kobei]|uniref:hypothetical protein n=1 Tax=Enterobacter kobei TaxID=208224 RepID=UPI003D6E22A4
CFKGAIKKNACISKVVQGAQALRNKKGSFWKSDFSGELNQKGGHQPCEGESMKTTSQNYYLITAGSAQCS